MKTAWDYTDLAAAYVKRPEYSQEALQEIYHRTKVQAGDMVCDIGAGVAHLTLALTAHQCHVDAVEPNDAMRTLGQKRTVNFKNVQWFEGTGEHTGRPSNTYDFVSFGSSFNVCDRMLALKETHRLLKDSKWFTCMWNHRQLDDPIQSTIETIIAKHIPQYGYGTRREDQSSIIAESGLFEDIQEITGNVLHRQSCADVVEAWRSHATLHRQAKEKFSIIIHEIEDYLTSLNTENTGEILIPYTTRAWIARKKG